MGIGMGSRCSSYSPSSNVDAPNPDPARFEIMETTDYGRAVVAKIKYPDCTNFEGIKICVYIGITGRTLRSMHRLDPHFSTDVISPMARFRPSDTGKRLAAEFATLVSNVENR